MTKLSVRMLATASPAHTPVPYQVLIGGGEQLYENGSTPLSVVAGL
jgi:hypothetical protein